MARTSLIVAELEENAVVTDLRVLGGGHVEFIIDAGFSPDGQARLAHVLDGMPLDRGMIADAQPISKHKLKVRADTGPRGDLGLGGGLGF